MSVSDLELGIVINHLKNPWILPQGFCKLYKWKWFILIIIGGREMGTLNTLEDINKFLHHQEKPCWWQHGVKNHNSKYSYFLI